MGKTEQAIRTALASKGYVVVVGKRAFNVAKKLESNKAIENAKYSYEVYNINGPEFRSQWNSPRSKTGYECAIHINV